MISKIFFIQIITLWLNVIVTTSTFPLHNARPRMPVFSLLLYALAWLIVLYSVSRLDYVLDLITLCRVSPYSVYIHLYVTLSLDYSYSRATVRCYSTFLAENWIEIIFGNYILVLKRRILETNSLCFYNYSQTK